MAFWDNLFGSLFGRRESSAETPQETPDQDQRPPSLLSSIFGGGRSRDVPDREPDSPDRSPGMGDTGREEAREGLEDFAPQDDSQGLFYLGWIDKNLSPDARREARQQFEDEYGRFDAEQWARWRRKMGYA